MGLAADDAYDAALADIADALNQHNTIKADRARLTARVAELEAVKSAGYLLANCAFNLAQMPLLSDDERRSLDESRQAFDAATRALSNKEKADG